MENEATGCPEPVRPKTRVPLRIEETLAGIAIGLLALITFANVVVRYLTNFSFAFTEEFSIFLMLVMALIGSSSVMAKNGHLSINFFVDLFRTGTRRWIRIGSTGMVVIMFLALAVLGGRMAWDEYRYEVTSPGLGIPTWIYTVWLPVLSIAVTGRAVGVIIRFWRNRG
ncbi:MAG: TRAP transporter small permease [Desulfobacteraceae bacterium]|nr:MAG: TRAP transporter small permease [Desulfobacteraceae bacterium]